ncbi:MAG: AMP-binding protein [Bacteroidales bacterium]|nr:AMP-binding protein [Bacteroides sp.]MCM1198422.1 AMP-binding protein [Clostridium sp.]MCM1501432.1 AMP-binding protein [Bacteroidales bacterium]
MNYFYRRVQKLREKNLDTLAKLYEYSTVIFEKNPFTRWADSKDGGYTFGEFRKKCDGLSKKLTQYGIGAGDKVAILSQSMPNWSVAFFSTVPFGRIAIPILPDSSENEVTNILRHSESKVIFVSERLLPKLSQECMDRLTLVIDIDTFDVIKADDEKFTCDGKVSLPMPDDIATIIYTSGTTGSAKGVVLSHRNLMSNVISSYHTCKRTQKDRWLSILPMAHTLEMTICMLYPMYCGACVYYLSKPPVASILMKALKTVKPTTMLSVPLIIEKVYKSSILPTIQKSRTLTWMNTHMNGLMCKIIGLKLKSTFGGHLTFFGIGGAKMDSEVEAFLLKAGFPYAIGYGLTETSPLLSYAMKKGRTPGSIGYPVKGVKLKLHDVNPETGEGEIVAKGDNVMLGYYKDPKRTKSVFTEDEWFRTSDLAIQDEKGRFFIKGRKNNMILGPSGENIYPEEIENVINNVEGVNESIVVERNGHLVALVQLDENIIDWDKESEDKIYEKLDSFKDALMKKVNKNVNKTSKINSVEVMKEPFEKTATSKIRRFKYKDSAPTVESESSGEEKKQG